jgi:protein SMG7
VAVFLKLHGLLHNSSNLQEAEKCVKILMTTLTAHVATESLTSWKLVQVCTDFIIGNTFSGTHSR